MTPAQAAEELGITTRAVQDRLKRGLLRGTNYGGRIWLIDRAEVERAKVAGRLKRGPKPGSRRRQQATPTEHRREEDAHDDALDEARQRIRGGRHDEAAGEARRRTDAEGGQPS